MYGVEGLDNSSMATLLRNLHEEMRVHADLQEEIECADLLNSLNGSDWTTAASIVLKNGSLLDTVIKFAEKNQACQIFQNGENGRTFKILPTKKPAP